MSRNRCPQSSSLFSNAPPPVPLGPSELSQALLCLQTSRSSSLKQALCSKKHLCPICSMGKESCPELEDDVKSRSQACPQARTLSGEQLRCGTMAQDPRIKMTLLREASHSTCTRHTDDAGRENSKQFLGILPRSFLENIVNSSWVMLQKHRGHTSEPCCPVLHTLQVQFMAPLPKRLHRTDH